MSRPRSRNRSRRPRRRLVLGGGLLAVALGLGLALSQGAASPSAPRALPATPTVDPRLIIRPRSVPVVAVLSHGIRLRGTLYPAYPGPNTLRLLAEGPSPALAQGSRATLVATMPGMAMPPIRATLIGRDQHYSGRLTLPMFGTYEARVTMDTAAGRAAGTLTLLLALGG